MVYRKCIVYLMFYIVHLSAAGYTIPTYRCNDEQKCIKEFGSIAGTSVSSNVFPTLNHCRLLCGKFGPLWPRPTGRVELGKTTTAINLSTIKFEQFTSNLTAEGLKLLEEIEKYFLFTLRREYRQQTFYSNTTPMSLVVKMYASGDNTTNIEWSTDESYKLHVSIDNITTVVATIEAATVFGVRHGCETLLQLFTVVKEANSIPSLHMLSEAVITDQPAYAHRGLLIDTARNYIPINSLKRQLDAMAASKMNVLHWHLTDTQSFPIQLNRVAEMASYGAYDSSAVYSPNDVRKLIRYAKNRGIRVILELDAPAHAGEIDDYVIKIILIPLIISLYSLQTFHDHFQAMDGNGVPTKASEIWLFVLISNHGDIFVSNLHAGN
uniref:beta-N-acetylhexosaminidase n=1 Tax=Anopheles stephensi TaxID=30069 RepID=A0A182YEM4_ANOST